MKRFHKALLVWVALLSANSHADGTAFVGYASGAHNGLEFGLGFVKEIARFAISVQPIAGVFYSVESDSRYSEETFSNGRMICRDHSNGQFADKEKCSGDIGFEYTPSVEFLFRFESPFVIGAGFRGGEKPGSFGTVMYSNQRTYFGVRAGPEYKGVALGGWF